MRACTKRHLRIDDFSVERRHFLSWRVLYKGNDWIHEHNDVLPMAEWCPTKRWAIRKARRLAGLVGRQTVFPVAATDREMRIPSTDARAAV